jgi:hypothetical protein
VSQSASQAAAFRRDVVSKGIVWTIEDDGGIPAPMRHGQRAMPFWSSHSRVERIIARVDAYAGMRPRELSLEEFETNWLPDLERDGFRCGVNWSGDHAIGYDLEPRVLQIALNSERAAQQ